MIYPLGIYSGGIIKLSNRLKSDFMFSSPHTWSDFSSKGNFRFQLMSDSHDIFIPRLKDSRDIAMILPASVRPSVNIFVSAQ